MDKHIQRHVGVAAVFLIAFVFLGTALWFVQNQVWAEQVRITATVPDPVFVEQPPIKLLFFGDIMLDRGVAKVIAEKGGLAPLWEAFGKAARLDQYDAVIANLEGAVTKERIKTNKAIAFRFDPALMGEVKDFGIDIVSLANNHTYDMGVDGYTETQEHLDAAAIEYFGHPTQVPEEKVLYKEIAGKEFAFVGLNTTFFTLTRKAMEELVRKVEEKAQVTVVMMHWGEEYQVKQNSSQVSLAHALIDAGADIVIGAHPHVVQGTEVYKEKPIAYSLGNFIFDQYFSKATQKGIAAEVIIGLDGKITLRTLPFTAEKSVPTWD